MGQQRLYIQNVHVRQKPVLTVMIATFPDLCEISKFKEICCLVALTLDEDKS